MEQRSTERGPSWQASILRSIAAPEQPQDRVERRVREHQRMIMDNDRSSSSSSMVRSGSSVFSYRVDDRSVVMTNGAIADPNHPGHSAYIRDLNYMKTTRHK